MRVLFLPGFTSPSGDYKASDAVGYGITAAQAIMRGLSERGVEVALVEPQRREGDLERQKLAWVLDGYRSLLETDLDSFDVILVFHSFQHFPSEVRRILLDLKASPRIVGYSHGSHWDPTDTFRFVHYPGMEMTDLANLLALDRVLMVSEYARETVLRNIGEWHPDVARRLETKMRVVGLPLDTHRLESFRTGEKFERPTIVYNHSLLPSKQPEVFARVAERALERLDVNVILTRHVEDEALARAFARLAERYPGRFTIGGTYGMEDYIRTLWKSDVQLSTATHEHLGIATLEAMYTGNCCLLPRRCSYPEITGGLDDVLYSSEEELNEKLERFLGDAAERERTAAILHERSLRYAPQEVVGRIIDVLTETTSE